MNEPDMRVIIKADLIWMKPSENDEDKMLRHQQQHVVNAMALDLESVVREILKQMIFHRAKLDG